MGSPQILVLLTDSCLRGLLEDVCTDEGLDVNGCRTLPELCAAITGQPGQVVVLDQAYVDSFLAEESRCQRGPRSFRAPLVILAASEGRNVAIDGRDVIELPIPFDLDEFLRVVRLVGGRPLSSRGRELQESGQR